MNERFQGVGNDVSNIVSIKEYNDFPVGPGDDVDDGFETPDSDFGSEGLPDLY